MSLVGGCSTSSRNGVSNKNSISEDISNSSFDLPPAKNYSRVDDFLDKELTNEPDVLATETLSKVPSERIEEPEDVSDALKSALVACYRKQFKLADELFDKLYRSYRNNPIYWSQVGSCFLIKGNKRKALLFFNKAKDLKKNYAPPINNIGVIFEKEGFDQKALKAYEEAKNLSSFSLTPLFNIAQIYTKYGLITQGKEYFSTLITLNNKDQDSIYAMGYLEMIEGDFNNAIGYFNRLSRDYRRKAEVSVNIAYTLHLTGNTADARDVLAKAEPTNNDLLNQYIARVRAKIGS
jgi:tetratricopeptide (TPR) repeat protein